MFRIIPKEYWTTTDTHMMYKYINSLLRMFQSGDQYENLKILLC